LIKTRELYEDDENKIMTAGLSLIKKSLKMKNLRIESMEFQTLRMNTSLEMYSHFFLFLTSLTSDEKTDEDHDNILASSLSPLHQDLDKLTL
ncbi:29845_t:CDS:2, partial [Racocetra persica]